LDHNFPSPIGKVKVEYVSAPFFYKGDWCDGLSWRRGNRMYLRMYVQAGCRKCTFDTLIHEWCHIHTATYDRTENIRENEGHDEAFYLTMMKINNRLNYENGEEEILEWPI